MQIHNTPNEGLDVKSEPKQPRPVGPCRLTLVCSTLQGGGAERVMCILSEQLAARGHEVTLLTIQSSDMDFYSVAFTVNRQSVDTSGPAFANMRGLTGLIRRLSCLRKALLETRPDVVLSFIDTMNIMTLLAMRCTSIPVTISERIAPNYSPIAIPWKVLRRISYPWSSKLVVQTEAARAYFQPYLTSKTVVIPNPVRPAKYYADPRGKSGDTKTLISLGRFRPQKGFDRLIAAFAEVSREFPDWRLRIVGDGETRSFLEETCRRLRIEERVDLPGEAKEPSKVLADAHLFGLTSHFEGFPNALCEALACGLPAVAMDCPNGPGEIIRHGVDGLLVPKDDCIQMANALRKLMTDADLRESMGLAARSISDRFNLETVVDHWEQTLLSPLKVRHPARGAVT